MGKRGQGEGTISRRPDGTWWGRATIGMDESGQQIRKAFYGSTRKEVQDKLTEAVRLVNDGEYIEPSRMLLSEWMDTWLKEHKKVELKPSSYYVIVKAVQKHIIPSLGGYPLSKISVGLLQNYINDLVGKGLAASTVIKIVKYMLQPCLDYAVKKEMLRANPCEGVELPKMKAEKRAILSKEEQQKFVETASMSDSRYARMFIFILGTGLRIGEALALTWSDIDFDKRMLNVNKGQIRIADPDEANTNGRMASSTPKTQSSFRAIPLLPATMELLEEIRAEQGATIGQHPAKTDYVFQGPTAGTMCSRMPVNRAFRKIIAQAGLSEKLTIHSLRHTFATRGLENGIPVLVMKDLLGHATTDTTADCYTHVLLDTKQDCMELLMDSIPIQQEDIVKGMADKIRKKKMPPVED